MNKLFSPLTMIISVLFLQENFSLQKLFGTACVIFGIFLLG